MVSITKELNVIDLNSVLIFTSFVTPKSHVEHLHLTTCLKHDKTKFFLFTESSKWLRESWEIEQQNVSCCRNKWRKNFPTLPNDFFTVKAVSSPFVLNSV
ncbi:CLUMA_CG004648, isoform A [Clunio marinus]|uniref:CLUMA_CG004648, isoform A n=1 Tax=Clunio marinus TaxID=568069 RepID=A0A1J1HSC7_9DIPT|nr:CLUMA_CG004648, isoform A [Clunio marinus]